MTYEVTYRAKDGHEACEPFEAESRDALFKALAAKGISPIRVAATAGGRKPRPARSGGRDKARLVTWAAVGVVVAICAFFVAKHLEGGKEASTSQEDVEKRQRIATVPPAPATTPLPVVEEKPIAPVRMSSKGTPIPDNVKPDEHGVLRYPGGLRWVDTNDLHKVSHPRKKQLFKHHSENSIATILTLEPEKMAPFLVGRRPKFGQRFVDDFKASLYDEIEFPDDDTDDERELRNMVVAVKKEMADAMNRGEDIAKMMNDAQDELDRLVSYRDDLMKELKAIKNDEAFSDTDVLDFTAAANQMLKSQGLKELAMPNLTYRQLILQRRRERLLENQDNKE